MKHFLIIAAIGALLSAAAGAGTAWYVTGPSGVYGDRVSIGPWTTSLSIGEATSDPWTRARIARSGLLALPRSEAVYFSAASDSDGEALRSTRSYRVTGRLPDDVGLWSVTAYGADDYLMETPIELASVSSHEVERRDISVPVEPMDDTAPEPGVIAMTGDQRVTLVLRFYQHPDWDEEAIRSLELPRIEVLR